MIIISSLLVVLVTGMIGTLAFARRCGIQDRTREVPAWGSNLSSVAGHHTQVAGILSGFSITAVILIADARIGTKLPLQHYPLDAATLGLFTMDFFSYIATGILFSMAVEREQEHQYFLYYAASVLYYFSVAISFAALFLLVSLIGYDELRFLVLLMIAGSVIGGYLAIGVPMFDLLRIRLRFIGLLLALSVVAGLLLFFCGDVVPHLRSTKFLLSGVLPACAGLVSLCFLVAALTFLIKALTCPRILTAMSLAITFLMTSLVVYLTLLTMSFDFGRPI